MKNQVLDIIMFANIEHFNESLPHSRRLLTKPFVLVRDSLGMLQRYLVSHPIIYSNFFPDNSSSPAKPLRSSDVRLNC